ncbi:phage tail protein [Companilactobacillus furfuricola]|uniref:phage tail protein n=1 Tax=Companilactobacillus furfuricola TaxID=1462575 RepID=UPI000F76D154|nr:phage tail protein [Companilactobacillus furfuricola]
MTLIYLLDVKQELLGIVDDVKSGTEKIQINKANELNVALHWDKRNSELAPKTKYIAVPNQDDLTETHLYSITQFTMDYQEITFTVFETAYEDFTATWVARVWGREDGETSVNSNFLYIDELLEQLLSYAPHSDQWQVGYTPSHTDYDPMAFTGNDLTISDALSKAVEYWNVEFDFKLKFIGNEIGRREASARFKMGEDRTDLKFNVTTDLAGTKYTEDRSGIYTALVGYGATMTIEEPDPSVQDFWQNVYSPGTVKVIKESAYLYDKNENRYRDRKVAKDSEWRTDLYRELPSQFKKYYRVSTNQYLDANDVEFSADSSSTETGGSTSTVPDENNSHQEIIDFSQVEWKLSDGNPVTKPMGQGYVENMAATEQYGYSDGSPRIGVVKFDDEMISEKLLSRTYKKLLTVCTPKRQLEATYRDIGTVNIGDTIYLYDESLNIYVEQRITIIDRDLVNPLNSKITAGSTFALTPEDRQSGLSNMIRNQANKYS